MRPGRPKQHVHNWEMAWIFKNGFISDPDPAINSPGYFLVRRYWKCVKGGKTKHTMRDYWHEKMLSDHGVNMGNGFTKLLTSGWGEY